MAQAGFEIDLVLSMKLEINCTLLELTSNHGKLLSGPLKSQSMDTKDGYCAAQCVGRTKITRSAG